MERISDGDKEHRRHQRDRKSDQETVQRALDETAHGVWGSSRAQRSLKDCRITVLGTGDIGSCFARRAKAFEPACIVGNLTLEHTLDTNVSMFCEDLVNFAEGRPLRYAVDRTRGY